MNTIDLGYVIPGAYSGLSRIRGGCVKTINCDEWLTVGDYGILAVVIANSCISVTNGYGRNAVASYD